VDNLHKAGDAATGIILRVQPIVSSPAMVRAHALPVATAIQP